MNVGFPALNQRRIDFGVVAGDTVTLDASGATGEFATKNVGTAIAVIASGFVLAGDDAYNYVVGQPSDLAANITPASLIVSGLVANDKIYDGTTTAALNANGVQVTGLISGDDVTPSDAGNYDISYSDSLTADILQRELTFGFSSTIDRADRTMGQYGSTNLPYREQLSGGGMGSVRGYTPNAILGSDAVLLSTEIRSPRFNLLSIGSIKDQLQFGIFADYACLRQHEVPDFPRHSEIASVGFNINYNLDRFLNIQFEVGTQLMRPPFALHRDTRAAIIAAIAY